MGPVSAPVRMCVGCRTREPKPALVRLVWDPSSSAVVLDALQLLPGRGVYLHPQCAARALKSRAIPRGLRCSVDGAHVAALLGGLAGPLVG